MDLTHHRRFLLSLIKITHTTSAPVTIPVSLSSARSSSERLITSPRFAPSGWLSSPRTKLILLTECLPPGVRQTFLCLGGFSRRSPQRFHNRLYGSILPETCGSICKSNSTQQPCPHQRSARSNFIV
ncbi:hypothetical protein LINPERHAP1_LOCUS21300 [Linum perenne]